MKNIRPATLVGLVSLLLMALPAKADLLQATDPRFGPNSLTIDTSTQLAWLDLTATAGLSYQQVFASTGPGGIFSGFRFATAQEVLTLYSAAGIPTIGYYPLSTPSILTLISLVGPTGSFNGQPEINGNSATSLFPGTRAAPSIYATGIFGPGTINSLVYSVNGANSTSYGETYSIPELGNWLVKPVPEPGLCVIGIVGLICFTFVRRKIPGITSRFTWRSKALSSR